MSLDFTEMFLLTHLVYCQCNWYAGIVERNQNNKLLDAKQKFNLFENTENKISAKII